jgi:PUA-domain protein
LKYRQYFLKATESKELLDEFSRKLRMDPKLVFCDKPSVEVAEFESIEIFLLNGKPILARNKERIYPTLAFKEFVDVAPRVVVDMGAVPHVCNGADIMAPGIKRLIGDFKKDDFVIITDEKHGKPIALGEIMYDAEDAKNVRRGVVVKNLHFVGDKTWSFIKRAFATA